MIAKNKHSGGLWKRHQLMLMGSNIKVPNCIELRTRQRDLARLIGRAGWKKGYRYTLDAIILPIGRQAGLCFNMQRATVCLPVRNPA